ncbi:hypothetical protein FOVG_19949 [Fusarium oxysporum f. sp. pisi HDV247]|uniref:Uncharacterized protein n=1 Tax=Fusarium oxysporum f. sp. pisi HDV247 TaxID=1080344 RepID=W9NER7_FUSOX|nr:hypothetical protein FOVG_19949 [Fusarium oxysporum f. sp. pisi HDV247]
MMMSRRGLVLYLPLSKATASAGRFNQQFLEDCICESIMPSMMQHLSSLSGVFSKNTTVDASTMTSLMASTSPSICTDRLQGLSPVRKGLQLPTGQILFVTTRIRPSTSPAMISKHHLQSISA